MPRIRTDNPPLQKMVLTVPPLSSFEEVRQVLGQLVDSFQQQLLSQFPVTNYEGRRISNVGVPIAADDVVTLKYLVGGVQTPPTMEASNGGGGGAVGPFLRTVDLKDTTVGNDIADATIVHGPSGTITCLLVAGVLRQAITADLTVRLNVWIAGVSSVVGTFTIPHTTAINTAVSFTSFTTPTFPDLSVFTWDVTASDGSTATAGVASVSVWWQ